MKYQLIFNNRLNEFYMPVFDPSTGGFIPGWTANPKFAESLPRDPDSKRHDKICLAAIERKVAYLVSLGFSASALEVIDYPKD